MSSMVPQPALEAASAREPERRTMPPPELLDRPAPASVGQLVLETIRADEPVSRHHGPRAELAYLRALVTRRRAEGDKAGEREATMALARSLASTDRELDTATSLARRALVLGDDTGLRLDLAEWLTGLGEPALAAATLRGACDPQRPVAAAQTLVKIAVLMARANDPAGAADALEESVELDASQTLPHELLGAIAAWAPQEVPESVAAAGYLAAALRHEANEDPESAFEDRLRAFEIAPADEAAAAALAEALELRGLPSAADEVLREHAAAVAGFHPERARQVHLRRAANALVQESHARAAGAVIDGGLEGSLGDEAGDLVDRALDGAGLATLCALRAEARRSGSDAMALLAQRARAPGREGACAALLAATLGGTAGRDRADALLELSTTASRELSAYLLSAAAEVYAAAGLAQPARRCAEEAFASDPGSPRAVGVLARITADTSEPATALTIGEAPALLIRAPICEAIARAFEARGDMSTALTWTQRWLALRPGCPRAMKELIRRAAKARDVARLEDALGWVLAQPKPLDDLGSAFGDALETLSNLAPARAVEVARTALELYGPRVPGLRGRLLQLGDRAGDDALAIALLERLVSSDAKDDRAVERLFGLAERRAEAGDFDGAACDLARAASRGASPRTLGEHLEALEDRVRAAGRSLASDGTVALAEARVHALEPLATSMPDELSTAWRELGSARWDLALDAVGAEEAFYRAAVLASQGGMERYARDLCEFAGPTAASDALVRRASALDGEPKKRAGLLIEAANLAYAEGMHRRALDIAASAIQIDPSRADAVAIVERCCQAEGGLEILDRTYDVLAAAALGCYGRRAAHYRAARQLERRGSVDAALRHAVQCFEAVPSEGTSYVLMSRLAERAGEPTEAIRAIERVAEAAEPGPRATWLKRAAALAQAGHDDDAAHLRFDLLLRALAARPDLATVREVGGALEGLVARGEDMGMLAVRFERTATSALRRLDGPDGARIAVAMAGVAFMHLHAARLGLSLLERAIAADGDIDEYASLLDVAPAVAAGDPEATRAFVESLLAVVAKPYASAGTALLRLGSRLIHAAGDRLVAALLLVQAARRAPDDEVLISDADAAVRDAGDPSLERELDEAVPPSQRLAALLGVAEREERAGAWSAAIHAFERALRVPLLGSEQRGSVVASLRRLYILSDRVADAEDLLAAEIERTELSPQSRARIALDLSALRAVRGQDETALDAIKRVLDEVTHDDELLGPALRLARRTGDRATQIAVLSRLVDRTEDRDARLPLLRELASLLDEAGNRSAAAQHYATIVEISPSDPDALEALEKHAAERGDHEAIAALLAKRIDAAKSQEMRRTLRLRRAAVLEQRLGRLEDAATELSALLADDRDDVSALRYLADVRERLGDPLRAAPLWKRLGELAAKTDERAEYGMRAASDYLAGGDATASRAILESIAPIAARDAVLELRVEIARRQGDARTLSETLDQLATVSREPAERRADFLVEAARASASVGDDAAALDRIRRAVRLAPQSAQAILEARRFEYRARGGGTPREAQLAIDELTRIQDQLAPEQMELQAFLLAEELDVIQGGGAGMRELTRRHAELGPVPLVALGMAERLVRNKSFEAALPLFERALAGDLRGLRSRGRVALAAAEAAVNGGQLEAAARLLEQAAAEPDTRPLALRKKLEFVASYGEPEAAKSALDDLIRQSAGLDRARFLLQLGRLVVATDPDEAIRILADAFPLATSDRNLAAEIAEELTSARMPRPPSPPPEEEPPPEEDELEDIPIPLSARAIVARPQSATDRSPVPAPAPGGGAARETSLFEQLMAGSYEAGERLAELYGPSASERSRDLLVVRKHQAQLRPGDRSTLEKLHQAALLDRNTAYARAIEHILAGFDPTARPVPPPPLSALPEAPDLVAALLFRAIESPVSEALAITWDTGRYRRDAGHYGLTGVERVQPGATTIVGEVYGAIARLLGSMRTGLFHRRASVTAQSPTPLTAQVVLLSPPAVVLSGDVREETPELRYVLGAALAGAMPEHVLVNGLSEEHLRTLIEALRAAFGPVGPTSRTDPGVARLGQDLWQIVPPRGDRRLREIFAQPEAVTYEATVDSTRRAMRRAGLFAAGDVPAALEMTTAELGLSLDVPLSAPDGLARACAAHPALADLLRLATRSEYAEARWAASGAERRRDGAPRRFRGT